MTNPGIYRALASGYQNSKVKNPADVEREKARQRAQKLSDEADRIDAQVQGEMAKMQALREAASRHELPEQRPALDKNKALWAGGISALGAMLGARQPYVQGALDSFIGGQEKQSAQDYQTAMQKYQQAMGGYETQMQGANDQMKMLQQQYARLMGQSQDASGDADAWNKASINYTLGGLDDLRKHQLTMQEIGARMKPTQVEETLQLANTLMMADPNLSQPDAIRMAATMRLSPAASVKNTDTRVGGQTAVAGINAGSREKLAGINAETQKAVAGIRAGAQTSVAETRARAQVSAADIAAKAKSKYSWGDESADKADCSGLVCWAFKQAGVKDFPRLTAAGYANSTMFKPVKDGMQKGDLIFFRTKGANKPISHVGIYMGDGTFVHNPGKGKTTTRQNLSTYNWPIEKVGRYQGGGAEKPNQKGTTPPEKQKSPAASKTPKYSGLPK